MKRIYVPSIFLCIIIGVGVGLIAGNAWGRKIRAGEPIIHNFCSWSQTEGGRYNLTFRTATPLDGQMIYLELDGELFAEMEVPNSGSWTSFVDAVAEDMVIPSGGEFQITYDRAQLQFSSISFKRIEI
ncbi:hypothetical protein P4B35_05470 [Pontiellaceae bacterium B12227]|nr:hypothetical protein [Pontiellaceae bacterium B12227]